MLNQNFARANRCTGLGVGAGAGAELVPGWNDLVERVAPRMIAKITEIQQENMRLPVILGTLYIAADKTNITCTKVDVKYSYQISLIQNYDL